MTETVRRHIALVAHDNKKAEPLGWAETTAKPCAGTICTAPAPRARCWSRARPASHQVPQRTGRR